MSDHYKAPDQILKRSRADDIVAFLFDVLTNGPTQKLLIEERGAAHGFSIHQLNRAKQKAGIVAFKKTFQGLWFWALPQDAPPDVKKRAAIKVSGNKHSQTDAIVGFLFGVGSQPYLPSGFQGRCKIATLHAGFGVIRGMSGNTRRMASADRSGSCNGIVTEESRGLGRATLPG